jgi:hypothetical protein
MNVHRCQLGIVHAGAPKPLFRQFEAEWLHQVQPRPGIGTQPDDIAGIGRYFRVYQYDLEHVSAYRK